MLTIIRGLPGSGKSTYARNNFPDTMLLEADMLAMNDGKYCFDREKLGQRHELVQFIAKVILKTGADLVVTGTMTRCSEVDPFIDIAKVTGSRYQILVCRGDFGSIHSVPESVLRAMRERWEDYPGERTAI